MRHIDQENRSHAIRNFPKARKINDAGICGAACDDHLRCVRISEGFDLLVINQMILLPDAVLHRIKPLSRHVGRCAVGKVSAGGQ